MAAVFTYALLPWPKQSYSKSFGDDRVPAVTAGDGADYLIYIKLTSTIRTAPGAGP
jgi:hypothetical protein